MKKLYEKDQVLFAIFWIVVYVVGFSNADSLSLELGMPKLLTTCVGLILSLILLGFIRKNGLMEYCGLCRFRGNWKHFLYFIPLIVITSTNLWNGVQMNLDILASVLMVVSMCFVGFLEEVIFRGLLFKSMSRSNVTSAIVVSSLTFGMGHIVNLLRGEPVFETMLQLVYASAIGLCYTAIFFTGGSILPCILSHALFNSLSTFSVERTNGGDVLITLILSAMSVGYGVWLLLADPRRKAAAAQPEGTPNS